MKEKEHELQFKDKKIHMGYQDIYFSKNKWVNLWIVMVLKVYIESSERAEVQLIDLFKDLGFANVDVLDNSDYEANIYLIWIKAWISLISKYDFILDWGTIEHVFHAPNYINNIYVCSNDGWQDALWVDG